MEQSGLKVYAVLPPAEESALDSNSSYSHILRLLKGGEKVVDFGCGPGNLDRYLSRRGCRVTGVDLNPEHTSLAAEYCEKVLVADLDTTPLPELFPNERFDVAIFADILEHLRNPQRLLAEVSRILRPKGFVIASIPNVAHGAVRLALLDGDFDYQTLGILDETHLRFFTRKSVESFFEHAGLAIDAVSRTTAPIFDPSGTLVPAVDPKSVPGELLERLQSDPEAETLQFVIRAKPRMASARSFGKKRVSLLERRVEELERDLTDARAALMQATEDATDAQADAARLRAEIQETRETLNAASALSAASAAQRVEQLEHELSEAYSVLEQRADLPDRAHFESVLHQLHVASTEADGLRLQAAALQSALEETQAKLSVAETEAGAAHANLEATAAQLLRANEALGQALLDADNARANTEAAQERSATLNAELEQTRNTLAETIAQAADARSESRVLADEIQSMRANLARIASESAKAEARSAGLTGELESARLLISGMESTIAEKSAEKDRLAHELSLSTEELRQATDRLQSIEQQLAEHIATGNDQCKRITVLTEGVEVTGRERDIARIELAAAIERVEATERQLQQREQQYKRADGALQHQISQVTSLTRECERLRAREYRLNEEVAETRAMLAAMESRPTVDQLEQAEQRLRASNARIEELSAEIHQISSALHASAVQQAHLQELVASHRDSLSHERDRSKEQGLQIREIHDLLKSERDRAAVLLSENSSLAERLSEAHQDIAGLKERLVESAASADALFSHLDAARTESAARAQIIANLEDEVAKRERETDRRAAMFEELKEALNVEIQRSEKFESEVQNVRAALDHEASEIRRANAERAAAESRAQQLKKLTEQLESSLEEARTHALEAQQENQYLRAQVRDQALKSERAEFYLQEMRQSKFWIARNLWFKMKSAFGIVTDIP